MEFRVDCAKSFFEPTKEAIAGEGKSVNAKEGKDWGALGEGSNSPLKVKTISNLVKARPQKTLLKCSIKKS